MWHIRSNLRIGTTRRLHSKGNIFVYGLIWNQTIVLEDRAYATAQLAHIFFTEFTDVRRFKKNRSSSWAILCNKHFHEGRLSCARMANNSDELLWFNTERDIFESNRLVRVYSGDFIVINHGISISLPYHSRPVGDCTQSRRRESRTTLQILFCFNKEIDISFQNGVHLTSLYIGAMIFDHLIRMQHI